MFYKIKKIRTLKGFLAKILYQNRYNRRNECYGESPAVPRFLLQYFERKNGYGNVIVRSLIRVSFSIRHRKRINAQILLLQLQDSGVSYFPNYVSSMSSNNNSPEQTVRYG